VPLSRARRNRETAMTTIRRACEFGLPLAAPKLFAIAMDEL